LRLVEIRVAGFRNLASGAVSWAASENLVVGANGQGKTNLLEAVTVLGNLRSFRTASMRQIVRHGDTRFLLEGRVETASGVVRISQDVSIGPPVRRMLHVAGGAVSMAQYLRVFPVFAMSGADRELVIGGPAERRSYLDRHTFLLQKEYFNEIRQYRIVLKQRNAALVNAVSDREMEVWEERLARAAAVVVMRRHASCQALVDGFQSIYLELRGRDFPDLELLYRGEAGFEPAEKVQKLEEYYRKRYNETRTRDRRTGFTGEGPHRHDLGLRADGRSVRQTLSSGQIKVVAAALRLASLQQVERERNEHLPVIIDDVDAELDAAVLSHLIDHLTGDRQLFLSTADEGLSHEMKHGSSRIEVRRGTVFEAAGERLDERSLHS
jgi:DNA replication and repair protein RecF